MFHPLSAEWFRRRFAGPTPAQELAWPAIAGGKDVLFICKSGARSALAAEFATAAGMDDLPLFNVEGGTLAWVEAGFPTGD